MRYVARSERVDLLSPSSFLAIVSAQYYTALTIAIAIAMYRKKCFCSVLLQVVILVSFLLYYYNLYPITQTDALFLTRNKIKAYSVVEAPKLKNKSEIEGLSQVTQNALLLNKKNTAYSVVEPNSPRTQSEGFLVSLGFWEQQTQGLLNFHQLQCLANHIGMRVVEPFLTGTSYSLNPAIKDAESLGKLINMDVWNSKLSSAHGYQPVLSWEIFKQEAPMQLIIHCIQYRAAGVFPRSIDFNGIQNGCSKECYEQFDPLLLLLQQEGFKQIRKSCTNVLKLSLTSTVSFKEFKESIFARYDPSTVTVIFDEFRGLDPHLGGVRLPLQLDSPCIHTRRLPPKIIVPSAQIMKDAERYYTKIAKNVGILARIEKIHANRHTFIECVEKAVQIKEELYKNQSLRNTFLSMDVGKYGSTSVNIFHANQLLTQGQTLFEKVYTQEENWTFQEWEKSFSSIASSGNVAYVANLQRTIAAKATCLILIGGGSFQEQAEQWHREQFYPELSNQCVYTVCT